jgi:hypothetical protein
VDGVSGVMNGKVVWVVMRISRLGF